VDISIVGASGSVGRQVAIGLVRDGLVPNNGRLQLVGRRGGMSEQLLAGVAADLSDAFAEDLPELDLAYDPKDVVGDVIILAAGDAVKRGDKRTRQDLAQGNREVVEGYARAIAKNGHGEELVLVLTNPVEASVEVCCRHLERKRVIGMGAYLDTLRFRQEIAEELGVRRQRVQGLVLGEHGPRMVPCWSTVDVHGFHTPDGQARLAALRRPKDPSVDEAVKLVSELVRTRGARAAYARAERFGPALRMIVKPYITQLCGARTPAGTAEMILRLLRTLMAGGQVLTAAQVKLAGEFLGIHGVVGAPIVLTMNGVARVVPYELSERERAEVQAAVYVEAAPAPRRARPRAAEQVRAWKCVLQMRSGERPGNAERISSVFAGRGISLDHVHAVPGTPATITLQFTASTRLKDHLALRLRRMRGVDAVKVSAVRA
jgi:malate dehydrogenase